MRDQSGLDFTQFDTETTDLHLAVVTPEVFQVAIRLPASEVTGAVQQCTFPGAERIGDKLRSTQFRPVQIPLGHALPADIQLAGHAHRHRLTPRIEHIDLTVADRSTDGNATATHRSDLVGRGEGRGFGRAVAVEQVLWCALRQYPGDDRRVQHVATDNQVAQEGEDLHQAVGILMEQPGGQPQHTDRLRQQQRPELILGQQHRVLDHYHATAIEQRRPDIQGAGVKGRIGGEGHAILPIEIGIAVVDHQASNGSMRNQYPFGRTSGTGGVHDIGDRLGGCRSIQVVRRFLTGRPNVKVETSSARAQGFSAVGQHQHGLAVLHHEGLTFPWRIDVQRHVDRRALEHRQLTDHQVDGARQQQRHAIPRLHAEVQQFRRQAVGLPVQLAVAQALRVMGHRRCFRRALYLGLEQSVHGRMPWRIGGGGVETDQHLLTLRRRQDRQAVQRCGRGLLQRLDQLRHRRLHITAQALRANLGRHQHRQLEAITQVVDVQGQRVVGAFLGAESFNAAPGRLMLGRGGGHHTVAVVEQRTEQRCRRGHAAATLGQHQRRMFVPEQCGQLAVGRLEPGDHRLRTDIDPQRQGIDKHPQGPVGALAGLQAAQQDRAEHHLLAARDTAQYPRPGQVHQARRTDPGLPGLGPQTQVQFRRQGQAGLFDLAPAVLHILQAERQGRLVDIAEHPTEKRFVLCLADTQACLGHIVAIRHRFAQGMGLAEQVRLDFMLDHVQRGMVEGHVMEQQHRQPTVIGGIPGKDNADQRRLAHIEAVVARIETLVQLLGQRTGRRIEEQLGDFQRGPTQDHLQRLVETFPEHRGTKDIVTVDHPLQGAAEIVQSRPVPQAEQRLQDIGIALFGADMVIKDAPLQRCQRVDVLHVRGAARHACQHLVDLRLGQVDQRQQVRSEVLAVIGDQVGRHHDFRATAHRRRQRGQGRLAEQHAHIGAQADLAHALDQADRQQRVAAQFEEMVITPDPLDLEHIGPDRGQQGFHFALRRLVVATGQGVRLRHRQRLAVDLAVQGQGQCVQLHIGTGHHVLRQQALQVAAQCFRRGRLAGRGDIGDQAFVAGNLFTGQHDAFADLRVGAQARLDFPQFDPETANLHLVVVTPQAFQQAIGQPAAEVAGAIEQGARLAAERVGDKFLGGQIGTVEITVRYPLATNADLTTDAQRQQLLTGIEDIDLGIADGTADRHAFGILGHCGHVIGGRVGGGFGRSVAMHQAQLRRQRQQATERRRVTAFTPAEEDPQALDRFRDQLHVLVEHRRGDKQHRGLGADQQLTEARRFEQRFMVHHQHLAAIEQGAPDIHGAGVERRVGDKGDAVLVVEVGVAVVDHQARDRPVRHHHALGHPGGA